MAVERAIVAATGIAVGSSAPDGSLAVERMHCFGLRAIGPNVMIDGRMHPRVEASRVGALLGEVRA